MTDRSAAGRPDRAAGPDGCGAGPDRCPRCGARFGCGIASGACWCASLPPLPALPAWRPDDGSAPPAGCLCPDCLRALAAAAAPPRSP